jgi:hypothetical protein
VDVLPALDQAIETEAFDWLRYSLCCWLVWSSSDTETICRKILRVPGMEGASALIIAMDINDGFGYLPPYAWEWIRKDRGSEPVNTWMPVDQPGLPEWLPTGNVPPLLPDK